MSRKIGPDKYSILVDWWQILVDEASVVFNGQLLSL